MFNYHTKIVLMINSITFEELELLVLFRDNYLELLKKVKEKESSHVSNEDGLRERGITLLEVQKIELFKNISELESLTVSLGSYGLISTKPGRMNGTLYGPLTKFGKMFLDFVLKKDNPGRK